MKRTIRLNHRARRPAGMARLIAACAAVILGLASAAAQAAYPDHPITLIVPFQAGGGVDAVGRLYAQYISTHAHANIVVDNRGGAGGTIGVGMVSRSTPDGYRIVIASPGNISIAASTYRHLPYNPTRDLAAVAMAVQMPIMLVTPPNAPFTSVQQIIAYGKAHPGKLNYGSGGAGSSLHLAGALFAQMAGFTATHVPYNGTAPALTDLMAGRLDYMFSDSSAMPLVSSGKLKLLAVASSKRSVLLPNTPTVAEAGLPGYEALNWYGFFAPSKTPKPIVAWLHKEVLAAQRDPAFVTKLHNLLVEAPPAMSSKAFAAFVAADVKKWAPLVHSLHISFD